MVTQEIESGAFPSGSPFYSLKELCARFDFSVITARRIFEELKIRGMLRTNGRQGAFVMAGIKPETVYLALRPEELETASTSRFFCSVMEGFRHPPFDTTFRIQTIALDFCLSHPESFMDASMIVVQDALFQVTKDHARVDQSRVDALQQNFHPIVFQVCIPIPGFTEVGVDMGAGIAEMVALLYAEGHRRIGYLTADPASLWFRSRFRGYMDGLETHVLPFAPALIAVTTGLDAREDHAATERLLSLPEPPTALVCANETRALNVLNWCREKNIRVPDDLSITAFGNCPETELSHPSLTTHDPHDADMGTTVLDLLQKSREGRLKEPVSIMIRPELIKRQSHGPAAMQKPIHPS